MSARHLCIVLGAIFLSLAPRTVAARESTDNPSTQQHPRLLMPQDVSMIGMEPADFHARLAGTRAQPPREPEPARPTDSDHKSAAVRPGSLVPLYAGMVALQALDFHST